LRQLQSALRVAERRATGGVLCRPLRATTSARRSIAVPWRERPPFWTRWPAKPAASEVVAHATLSVSQPERSSSDSCIERALNPCRSTRDLRPSRRDCAASNSRAPGAARCSRSAPPALRAADGLDRASHEPFLATIDGRHTEVLDDVQGRRYCLIIFAGCTRGPLHIVRCGARSNRRFQTTVRSPSLNSLLGYLFVRRHVREADNRIGPRLGPRPGADPTVHHTSKSSRCHGGTPVRGRCVGRCAQRAHSP